MTTGPATSVVVVSYRPGEWLRTCLESVAAQATEVVVVDNGSPGAEAARVAAGLGLRAVRSGRNRGFTGGVNLGVRAATGAIVVLLNDDAVAPPGWIGRCAEVLDDPGVAVVAPKVCLAGRWREVLLDDPEWRAPGDDRPLGRQLRSVRSGGRETLGELLGPGVHRFEGDGADGWRWTAGPVPFYVPVEGDDDEVTVDGVPAPPGPVCRLVNSAGTFLRPDGYAGDIGIGAPDDGRLDRAGERFGVSGTAMAVRRDTWDLLGPLAAPYFAYYEDVDWCWRARLAGLRVIYDPDVTVTHRRGATSGGQSDERVRVLAEANRTLSMVRNAPRALAWRHLRQRWADGPDGGVRARAAGRLPWAVATRVSGRRHWRVTPEAVWERWAGAGEDWDRGPARV